MQEKKAAWNARHIEGTEINGLHLKAHITLKLPCGILKKAAKHSVFRSAVGVAQTWCEHAIKEDKQVTQNYTPPRKPIEIGQRKPPKK